MRFALAFIISTGVFTSRAAHATEVTLAEQARSAFSWLIDEDRWPSLPSDNTRHRHLRDPDPAPSKIFDRLLSHSPLARSGFRLRVGPIGNVVCDSERKLILAEPDWLNSIGAESERPDLILTALFAHELGHYVVDLYRALSGNEVFGPAPFKVDGVSVYAGDADHARVEALAAELMRRAKYNDAEIQVAFEGLHGRIRQLEVAFGGGGTDPSSDLLTRMRVIRAILLVAPVP